MRREKKTTSVVMLVMSENASYRGLQNQSVLITRRRKEETITGYIASAMLAD